MTDKVRQSIGLTLAFLPGSLFILGLITLRIQKSVPWLSHASQVPWELWLIGVFGTVALIAAFGDWYFHAFTAKGKVSPLEEKGELIALGGGGFPMFVLMALASVAGNPTPFLIPIICVLIFTVVMICHDEFVFHRRRCGRYENFLHKVIVFGNGIAWLSWFHWIFIRVRLPL